MRNETVEVKLKKALFSAFVCGVTFAGSTKMAVDGQIDLAVLGFILCFINGSMMVLKGYQIHVEYTDMQLLNKLARFPLAKESKDV